MNVSTRVFYNLKFDFLESIKKPLTVSTVNFLKLYNFSAHKVPITQNINPE